MPRSENVVVVDFGDPETQLIARRVRDHQIYSQIVPYTQGLDAVKALSPNAVILSGSPASVYEDGSPAIDPGLFGLGIPVLGICYGMQLITHLLGGKVARAPQREEGSIPVTVSGGEALFQGLAPNAPFRMSHNDGIVALPEGFVAFARTDDCPIAAMKDERRQIYAVQFHPEAPNSPAGDRLLYNFLYEICRFKGGWDMDTYAADTVDGIRDRVKAQETVLLALSGGVDSSVCAALLYRAIGGRLTCVFVDHGLMRKGEPEQVMDVFTHHFPVKLIHVDASDRFYHDLAGVTDPEQKRKIIGADFIEVFKAEAQKLGHFDHFAQGTIYPDVIESGAVPGGAVIKSHHNVGGMPAELGFGSLIEPLRMLFKDEVRRLGETLGLPRGMVRRQPFPGPGLAIRTIGEVTREKVQIVRESDGVLRDEIEKCGLSDSVGQYFTVLTDVHSVGVANDARTYDYTVAVRAVNTLDFMTASVAPIPHDILARISARIISECEHVNRVVYDITGKPPATIEWE
jgi:GMP synthase (glutamine-hydrolysing)